jgi:hypothetical protein
MPTPMWTHLDTVDVAVCRQTDVLEERVELKTVSLESSLTGRRFE